jgi:hypothetical protein
MMAFAYGPLKAITLKNVSDTPIEMEVYLIQEKFLTTLSKGEIHSYTLTDKDLNMARTSNHPLYITVIFDKQPLKFCDDINLKKYNNNAINKMEFVFTENHTCKVELPRAGAIN